MKPRFRYDWYEDVWYRRLRLLEHRGLPRVLFTSTTNRARKEHGNVW